jgi:hypothetical protein
MMAVAHPTVVFMNLCSKKGVQLVLLLLPLELGTLCMELGWLVLRHCKVMGLAAFEGVLVWTYRQARRWWV